MDKQDFIFWARKLQDSYQPSEATQQKIAQIDLLAVVGPTGVGKTTLIEELRIPYVRSDVTRAPRSNEKNHRDYNFRDDYLELIEQIKRGEFVQFYVSGFGEFYGTHIDSYPDKGTAAMAVIAELIPHFTKLGFRSLHPIYVMPPSYAEWMRRIGTERSAQIDARIDEARRSLSYAQDHESDFIFVLNDTLEHALQDVTSILAGQSSDEHRSALARDSADLLLRYIGSPDSE